MQYCATLIITVGNGPGDKAIYRLSHGGGEHLDSTKVSFMYAISLG